MVSTSAASSGSAWFGEKLFCFYVIHLISDFCRPQSYHLSAFSFPNWRVLALVSAENSCFIPSVVLVALPRAAEERGDQNCTHPSKYGQTMVRVSITEWFLCLTLIMVDSGIPLRMKLIFQRTVSVEKDLIGNCVPSVCCWGCWSQAGWTGAFRPLYSCYSSF